MSTPIVISDDEGEKKTPRLTASHNWHENQKAPSVLQQNRLFPGTTAFTGGENFHPPMSQIFSQSFRRSNGSTTEKQLAGPVVESLKHVPSSSQAGSAASETHFTSGREASGHTRSERVEVIDLTVEGIPSLPRMNWNSPRSPEGIEGASQLVQRHSALPSPADVVSDPRLRTHSQLLARTDNLLGIERTQTRGPDAALSCHPGIRGADKGSNSALRGNMDNSSDPPRRSSGMGRMIPWSSEGTDTIIARQISSSSPMGTYPPRRDLVKTKSSSERLFQNQSCDKGQANPAIDFAGNQRHAQNGDSASRASPNLTHPRLKLNGPKRPGPNQQDHVNAGYLSSRATKVQQVHTSRLDTSLGSRGTEQDQRIPVATLSKQVEQTRLNESDSDDAGVRMQRSIDQALARYSQELQAKAESPEVSPAHQSNKDINQATEKAVTPEYLAPERIEALGSPELGEHIAPANHMIDMDLAFDSTSKVHQRGAEVADIGIQPEARLSCNLSPRRPNLQLPPAVPQPMTTKTSSEKVAVGDELVQSATGQGSPLPEQAAPSERGNITPDIKILEAIFKPLVEEMRAGQEYLMSGLLSRVRKDVLEFPLPDVDQSLSDPFAAAASKPNTPLVSFNPLLRVRMESRLANARTKAPPMEAQAIGFESEAQRLPKYNSIVRLCSNILAPNDKDLRYLPYFPSEEDKDGADAANHKRREELLEGFDNRIKFLPEERKCAEQAEFWRESVEYFLEEVGCTCVDVMCYLLHDDDAEWRPKCPLSEEALLQWQKRETCCEACGTKFEGQKWDRLWGKLSEHTIKEENLALAGLVCSVFSKRAKFNIWHIVSTDAGVQNLIDMTEKRWAATQEPKGTKRQSLCMLCHMFDCPTHGAYLEDDLHNIGSDENSTHSSDTDQESSSESVNEGGARHNIRQNVSLPERPKWEGQQHRCGFYCVDTQTRSVDVLGLHQNGEVKGCHNMDQPKGTGDAGFGDGETCSDSCFWDISNRPDRIIAEMIHPEPTKRFVNWSEKDVKIYKSMLATCISIRRGPCIMSITLSRPCSEIFAEMLREIYLIPHPVLSDETNIVKSSSTALTHGYKDKHYWLESSHTFDHHQRRPFIPCSHPGPCHKNPNCTCWSDKVACEWICGCDRTCSRRFQGCRCIARGAKVCFKDTNCDCWVLNRECDPWLCGKCGVLEVLDPVNRHDDRILKSRCRNAMIQRNIPKRTLKAPSEVHGWGLFAGTDIRANDFIGEYKGEVISEEESNRRGLVYHYRGIEYLFRLNKEQEIDSSRAGNKMRFINNSERPGTINVYPQTMLCNGVQRIGLFAKRNIVAGEEMFFNYGYPESITKNFWEREDLEAGRRLGSDEEVHDEGGRLRRKGVNASRVAAKKSSKKGIGRKIEKSSKKGNSKERHAHFLDDHHTFDNEPEASTSNSRPFSRPLPRKRKRIPSSSPVIDETTFDLPEYKDDPSLPKNETQNQTTLSSEPPHASSSSYNFGPYLSIPESDSEDEEYAEEEEDEDGEDEADSDSDSASEVFDLVSDDPDETHPSGLRRASIPARQSRLQTRQSSRTTVPTTAAVPPGRRSSRFANRRAGLTRSATTAAAAVGISPDIVDAKTVPATSLPAAATGDFPPSTSASATSTPRRSSSRRKNVLAGTKDEVDIDADEDKVVPTIPPQRQRQSGKKRGRPFGWKKGVHFK